MHNHAPMPYHVMIWPRDSREQAIGELYAFNLTEDQLRDRFIEPYNAGGTITWGGRTVTGVDSIQIGFTEQEVVDPGGTGNRYEAFKGTQDVTNEWITGPPGGAVRVATQVDGEEATQPLDPRHDGRSWPQNAPG